MNKKYCFHFYLTEKEATALHVLAERFDLNISNLGRKLIRDEWERQGMLPIGLIDVKDDKPDE